MTSHLQSWAFTWFRVWPFWEAPSVLSLGGEHIAPVPHLVYQGKPTQELRRGRRKRERRGEKEEEQEDSTLADEKPDLQISQGPKVPTPATGSCLILPLRKLPPRRSSMCQLACWVFLGSQCAVFSGTIALASPARWGWRPRGVCPSTQVMQVHRMWSLLQVQW